MRGRLYYSGRGRAGVAGFRIGARLRRVALLGSESRLVSGFGAQEAETCPDSEARRTAQLRRARIFPDGAAQAPGRE